MGQRAWVVVSRNRHDTLAFHSLTQHLRNACGETSPIKIFAEVYGNVDIVVGVQCGEGKAALFDIDRAVQTIEKCGEPTNEERLQPIWPGSNDTDHAPYIRATRTYAVIDSTDQIDAKSWAPNTGYFMGIGIATKVEKHQQVRDKIRGDLKEKGWFRTFLVDMVFGDVDVFLAISVRKDELSRILEFKEYLRTVRGLRRTVTYFSCDLLAELVRSKPDR